MAIKAIVFDCFGVLVEDSMNRFYRTYLTDKPDIIEQIKELDYLSTTGELTRDKVLDKIIELTSLERGEVKNFLDKNPPNLELINFIAQQLKPRYKIGFLSNAADNWLDDLFTREQQAFFDDFILSYQHGINKPNVEIFKLAANRLGVDSNECILIDDIQAYCEGAQQAGFLAIHYTSFEKMRNELDTILVKHV